MIQIDGSSEKAGGQVLRTALALSCALMVPFQITNIRKNRPNPGLAAQHLGCVQIMKALSAAEVSGDVLESQELLFSPTLWNPQEILYDIGTAGSISLLFQCFLLPASVHKSSISYRFVGGTDVAFAPPVDYLREVVLTALDRIVTVRCHQMSRGYFPVGGGIVEGTISPKTIQKSFSFISRHELLQISGISHASKDLIERQVVERTAQMAQLLLKNAGPSVHIQNQYAEAKCTGSGLLLTAHFGNMHDESYVSIGADVLGGKGKSSSAVGEEAAKKLLSLLSGSAVIDEHLADHLVPFLAFYGGEFKTTMITDHIRANIAVTELFLGKRFIVDEQHAIVRVEVPYLL